MNNFPGYSAGAIPRYDRFSQYNSIRFSGGAFDNLSVKNSFTIENDMNVYGDLTVRKNFIVERDILILENTNISGETTISNLLTVDDLIVKNDASINGTLYVDEKTTLNDNLDISGSTIIEGSLRVNDSARLGNITSGGFNIINYLGSGGVETKEPASTVSLMRHDGEMELRNGRSNLITLRRTPDPTNAIAIGPNGGFVATTFVKGNNLGTLISDIDDTTFFGSSPGTNNSVSYISNIKSQAISIGENHILVLAEEVINGKTEYVTKGFGNNSTCQLGCLGGSDGRTILDPTSKEPYINIVSIAAAKGFSVLLRDNGEVLILGNSLPGNMANYVKANSTDATIITDFSLYAKANGEIMPKIIQISAKNDHVLLLTIDYEIISLGLNSFGRLGRNDYVDNLSIEHIFVLDDTDNRVTNVAYVEAGGRHSLYITNNVEVYGFGNNDNKQIKDVPTSSYSRPILISDDFDSNEHIIDIAAGGFHSLFITYNFADPHVPTYLYTAGSNSNGQVYDNGSMGVTSNGIQKSVMKKPFICYAGRYSSLVVTIPGQAFRFGRFGGANITNSLLSTLLVNYGYYTVNIDTLFNANVTVMGDVVLNTDVSNTTYIRGKMIVDGSVGMNYTLDVSGVTTLYNRLDVSGATRLFDTLDVYKHTTLRDDVSMNQNADITDNLNVGGNVDIDGNTHIQGSIDVCGNVVLNTDLNNSTHVMGSLEVERQTELHNNLTVDGDSFLKNNVNIDGTTTMNQKATITNGGLDVNGKAVFNNDVSINGSVNVGGLEVSGNADFNNNVNIDGSANIKYPGNFERGLGQIYDIANNVTNFTQFSIWSTYGTRLDGYKHGSSKFQDLIWYRRTGDGSNDWDETLRICGVTSKVAVGRSLDISENMVVGGNADFNNNVNIDGTTTMNQKATITNGGLEVSGNADFNNDVNIDGTTTMNQKATITNGGLEVSGNADFNNNVNILGTTIDDLKAIRLYKGGMYVQDVGGYGLSNNTEIPLYTFGPDLGFYAYKYGSNYTDLRYKCKESDDSTLNTALCIKPNRNVGIGTETPDATLDVNGNCVISGTVSMGGLSITGRPAIVDDGNGAYMTFEDDTTRKGFFGFSSGSTSTITITNEKTNGGISLRPDGTGSILLDGTTTMNQKATITNGGLEVSGNADFNNNVNIDGSANIKYPGNFERGLGQIYDIANNVTNFTQFSIWSTYGTRLDGYKRGSNTVQDLIWYRRTGEGSNDWAETLRITGGSGRVGIGTSNPDESLQVTGAIALGRGDISENAYWKFNASKSENTIDDLKFEKYEDGVSTFSAYIQDDKTGGQINFTGQHHNYSVNEDIDVELRGFIVISTGSYRNQMNDCNECNKYKVTINESLPIVDLSKKSNDKKVFGVISDKDDYRTTREYKAGAFVTPYEQHTLDRPLTINSLGEGAIWVCNVNGVIENGDYITSSPIPGLGMIQNDDLLHNYTVAKSTMDCLFTGEQVPRKKLRQVPSMIEKQDPVMVIEQIQKTDESGNIVNDESGNPVMIEHYDSSGNPIMIEQKDENGKVVKQTVYDGSSNPIMVQDKTRRGELKYNPVVDEQGNFIYDIIYDHSGNQLFIDKYESKYVEVFSDKYVIYNDEEKTEEFYIYEFDFANGSQDQQLCIGNTYIIAFIGCTYHCG